MDQEMNQKFEELLGAVKEGFDDVSDTLNNLERDVGDLKQEVGDLKQEMRIVKSTMVTKDFMSRVHYDFQTEVRRRIRLLDDREKLFSKKLLESLKESKVIRPERVEELEEMLA